MASRQASPQSIPFCCSTAATEQALSNGDSSAIPDSVLGAKLNDMSIEERSRGLHDLHGVAGIERETPEMLKEKAGEMIHALFSAVAGVSAKDSLAYREAVVMSPEYADGLAIPFLRAENYNSKLAAYRMVRFFDHKMRLFGKEKLVQEITFQDLSKEAQEAVQRGLIQTSPLRDRAGRVIFFIYGVVNIMYETITCVSPRINEWEAWKELSACFVTFTSTSVSSSFYLERHLS
jgi:hypothetical protein